MLLHETSFLKQFYYEEVFGLKTGHTTFAGYTFTSTAKQKDRRLITVVMKTESEAIRFQETAKLLDYGFDNFQKEELFPAGYKLKDESTIDDVKGKTDTVDVALEEAIEVLIKKGSDDDYHIEYELDE